MKAKRFFLCIFLIFVGLSIGFTSIALGQTPDPTPDPDTPEPAAAAPGEMGSETVSNPSTADELLAAELLAFERAYHDGPEAIVALRDQLSPAALDIVMDDIQAAEAALAADLPPSAQRRPITPEEELAQHETLRQLEAINRAVALNVVSDPAEGQSPTVEPLFQTADAAETAVDRTVGSGCTYANIVSALASSNPGDRLLLEGGRTFIENLSIPINLTIQGGYPGCASGLATPTTINGNYIDRVIDIAPALDVTLNNLVLINADTLNEGGGIRLTSGSPTNLSSLTLNNVTMHHNSASWGGGMWIGTNAVVTGTSVTIRDNTATVFGGGIRLFGGQATFTNSNIYDNSAPSGAGTYATKENGYAPQLQLLSGADIFDNQATNNGGGLYMREGSVNILDCSDIYNNESTSGGGAYLITSTLTIAGSCSEIQDNEATGNGGGIYAQGSSINLDDEAELYNNTAGSDGSGSGGGIYLDDSNLFSDKAKIWYNDTDDFGGGIYAVNNSTVDMDLGSYTCVSTHCSVLSNNTATDDFGGGVYAYQSDVDLRNTFVEDNVARYGGGVYVDDGSLKLYNSLLAENDSTSGGADAIRLYTGATMTGNGITLAYNDAGGAATGEAVGLFSANMTLGCSVVWGHATSINGSTATVTYSDIEGGFTGTGNLNVNPQFVSAAIDDFHLSLASPVIDRCGAFTGMSSDFENEARPILHINPATPYDMGADEFSIPHVGINGSGCIYNTLAEALAIAVDGDALQVASGTYYENADILGSRAIDITGGYDSSCTTADAGTTTIDTSVIGGSVLDVDTATVTLHKLNLTGGDTMHGGGIELRNSAQVSLDKVRVHDNQATYGGGIYIAPGSAVTLTNNSDVDHNTAINFGGGVRVNGGQLFGLETQSDIHNNSAMEGGGIAAATGAHISLVGSDMYQNQATGATGRGGGVLLETGSTLEMSNAAFIYYLNLAYDGAGVYADASTVTINYGVLRQNIASNNGGAIYLTNNSQLTAINGSIGQEGASLTNEAQFGAGIFAVQSAIDFQGSIRNNDALSSGGGLYIEDSQVILNNTQVYNNNAGLDGGGLAAVDATVTIGVDETRCNPALTECSRFANNAADSDSNMTGYGGAIYSEDSQIDIEQTYLYRNAAVRGGAVYHQGPNAHADIVNTLVYSNTTSEAFGAGVRTENSAYITATHVTLANNMGGAAFSPSSSSAWVNNSIAWGNSHGGFVRTYVSTSCNIDQDGAQGLNIDPQFAAPGVGEDYHLSDTSPAIDVCNVGHDIDLEGAARPAGSGYDVGAYEHEAIDHHLYLPVIRK